MARRRGQSWEAPRGEFDIISVPIRQIPPSRMPWGEWYRSMLVLGIVVGVAIGCGPDIWSGVLGLIGRLGGAS